ncbi:uncharacterized protein LOC117651765 [Thrips palmi]|uniref:Uncharacterized protein LOC117651765 n=1 Tax=Thrips palmi TaxID=161013 RepID=A0A6P9A652_THRPL|nr:uncharacterized protein LOC117651765 [Thrips palmi]
MAASARCLRYLALVADVLFMVVGLTAAVLLLVLLLPLVSLLTIPKWLLLPLLLPLAPALVAIPLGFVAFSVTRSERRWRLIGVTVLQALAAVCMAVLAGWQVFLWFSPRVEADFAVLMNESLLDPKWHTAFAELRCCGPAGPASFHGSSGIPSACCLRDEPAPGSGAAPGPGHCSQLYSQGCVRPATSRIRAVLRDSAAVHGGAALLMFLCAVSSAFFAEALKRASEKRREQQSAQEEKPLRSPMLNQKF